MSLESAILELASSIRLLATSYGESLTELKAIRGAQLEVIGTLTGTEIAAGKTSENKPAKGAKVKTTTPPPPATEPEAPADAGETAAPAAEAPALSAVEIRAKVTALIQAAGRDAGIGLLKKFKAQAPAEAGKPPVYNASSLKPEHYAAFATEADELIAATK